MQQVIGSNFVVEEARSRWRAVAEACIPLIGLAYPLVIQPLTNFRAGFGAEDLDMGANIRNADANPINQLFWLGLLGLSMLVFRFDRNRLNNFLASPHVLLTACYLMFAVASMAWSPTPDIALRRSLLQIIVVFLILGTTQMARDRSLALRGCAWLGAATVAVNLPFVLLLPAGRMGGALGIYSNKNLLGPVMALSAIVMVHGMLLARSRIERFILLIASVSAAALLILSGAETSILLALIAPPLAAGMLFLAKVLHMRVMPMFIATMLAIACLMASYAALGGTADTLLTAVFGDPTFSGRTDIWRFVMGAVPNRTLLGMGYASFWGTGDNSYVDLLAPGFIGGLIQAHNGYLDVLVELGAVGLTLLICIIISGIGALDRGRAGVEHGRKFVVLTVMIFAILHNMLESSWFRSFSVVWLFYLFMLGQAVTRPYLTLPLPPNRLNAF